MQKELTIQEIIDYLRRYQEILRFIQARVRDLQKDYTDADGLIRELQLSCPKISDLPAGMHKHRDLSDICQRFETRKGEYQTAVYEEIESLLETAAQIGQVMLCFQELSLREKQVLKALYIDKLPYKELVRPGMSRCTLDRIRKAGLEQIQELYHTHNW